ncbi:maleylpyruvate isomerase family mycothiol-dependent enzyme [Couchioplanes caeruleus]|nr:maleylpyruvate isomerase family mycothiol-dependent enzyme [Couchioplanes caeruleus]
MNIHDHIADERRRAADLIESLSVDQLRAPSLCGQWTVHEVAAHLLMPLVLSRTRLLMAMVASGMDFDRANVRLTAAVAGRPAAEIAAGLREHAEHRFKPPGVGYEAPLTDLVIHQQDISHPLGIAHAPALDRVRVCLAYLTSGAAKRVVPDGMLRGLRLQATDLDWSVGRGALVRGPAQALLMAVAGRAATLAELDGDGADALGGRIAADLPSPCESASDAADGIEENRGG